MLSVGGIVVARIASTTNSVVRTITMSEIEKTTDRRKTKRYQIEEGAFAKLTPHCNRLGQIIDVSLGGLAFTYIDSGEELADQQYELEIFLADLSFSLVKLKVKSIADFEAPEFMPFRSVRMRIHCVQFKDLNCEQIFELDNFIRNYHTGEAPQKTRPGFQAKTRSLALFR